MDKGMVNIPDDSIYSSLQMDMTGTMKGPEGGGWRNQVHLIINIDRKNHPSMLFDRPFQQGIIRGCFGQDDIKNHDLRLFHRFEKGGIVKPPERPSAQFVQGFLVNFNEEDIFGRWKRPPQPEGKIIKVVIHPFEEAKMIEKENQQSRSEDEQNLVSMGTLLYFAHHPGPIAQAKELAQLWRGYRLPRRPL